MPLPNLRVRCRATCRATQKRCGNPAAYGMPVCAKHGAHRKVVKGEAHWNFGGKGQGKEDKAAAKKEMQEVNQLAILAKKCGLIN